MAAFRKLFLTFEYLNHVFFFSGPAMQRCGASATHISFTILIISSIQLGFSGGMCAMAAT